VSYCTNFVATRGDDAVTAVCYASRIIDLLGDVSNPASSFVHSTSSNRFLLRVFLESKVKLVAFTDL
jgi:hypothetical protein